MKSSLRKLIVIITSVVVAVMVLLFASGTIRLGLPDQEAMEKYLSMTPLDEISGVSDGVVERSGENPTVCFMCSVYGITKSFDLIAIPDEASRRQFCEDVENTITEWQHPSVVTRIELPSYTDSCKFEVQAVNGHEDWTMAVFVAFEALYPSDPPPFLIITLD